MRLPKDILNEGLFTKPRLFLCETNKEIICQLDATDVRGSFKFNSLSELSFEVGRVYTDLVTGESAPNPYYDKIEAPRLVFLEDFGYFELQGPELIGDGIKESKICKAYSWEYVLSTKYLEDFYINNGTVESLEVLNAVDPNKPEPITLYNPNNTKLSLLHLILEKIYGWKIGHVDGRIKDLSRQFEVDRESVYDFLVNEVCEKFNCYIVFDTINNTINVYAESLTNRFVGDGKTNKFKLDIPFDEIGTVSVDGYKTTRYTYDATTGVVTLADVPEDGRMIEVVDGALTRWETDVFVSFDNLSQEVNINYDADSIKTVLSVTYGEDNDIRETNLGLPYLTDLSYFYNIDWMGSSLYNAYKVYLQKSNDSQSVYTENTQKYLDIADDIDFEENRLSLEYSLVPTVIATTVGTYYVRSGDAPNYTYTEVSLPGDWKANTNYYSPKTTNLNEEKVNDLYAAIQQYYTQNEEWKTSLEKLASDFKFMEDYNYTLSQFIKDLEQADTDSQKDQTIYKFIDKLWNEIGRVPLEILYLTPYKTRQTTNIEAGWSQPSHDNYKMYYPVVLFIDSMERALKDKETIITILKNEQKQYSEANQRISDSLVMDTFFRQYFADIYVDHEKATQAAEDALMRLSAFLREDELHLDDIVETSQTSVGDSFKLKQDAMESGRIELSKLSQPQLQFSMSMANIYALHEFEPIIDQFQLGNVIKVALRPDYIKQSRLLQVDINFDDFSDFSCEFGELTNLRTQSDIHADLLSQAITAGKSVATNSSYWTKGSDAATKTDLKIQQGLLDATTQIKAIDGTQGVIIDKWGIHLTKTNPTTGETDPHQTWLTNNMILMSDDGFKTSRSALGEVIVDGQSYYGLIAEMVLSGYIEGSKIVGGTIKIGDLGDDKWAFEVDEDGNVSMLGGEVQFNMTTGKNSITESVTETENKLQEQIDKIDETVQEIERASSAKMYRVEIISEGPTTITTETDQATLTCKVYSWDTDITSTLDASLFSWKRMTPSATSEEGILTDEQWNAMPEHQGVTSITIGINDVLESSSFTCEVDLPEDEEV